MVFASLRFSNVSTFCLDAKRLKEVTKEEDALRAEKLLLERKLAREKERSDALNKQLSESESSLEIDDERLNEF